MASHICFALLGPISEPEGFNRELLKCGINLQSVFLYVVWPAVRFFVRYDGFMMFITSLKRVKGGCLVGLFVMFDWLITCVWFDWSIDYLIVRFIYLVDLFIWLISFIGWLFCLIVLFIYSVDRFDYYVVIYWFDWLIGGFVDWFDWFIDWLVVWSIFFPIFHHISHHTALATHLGPISTSTHCILFLLCIWDRLVWCGFNWLLFYDSRAYL